MGLMRLLALITQSMPDMAVMTPLIHQFTRHNHLNRGENIMDEEYIAEIEASTIQIEAMQQVLLGFLYATCNMNPNLRHQLSAAIRGAIDDIDPTSDVGAVKRAELALYLKAVETIRS